MFLVLLAAVLGNAATATKLQTARTSWGQSFDVTCKVRGALSDVTNIDFESSNLYDIGSNSRQARYIYAGWVGSQTGKTLSFGANNGTHMLINSSGNVTFGASDLASTTYKLYVDGKTGLGGDVAIGYNRMIGGGGASDTQIILNSGYTVFAYCNCQYGRATYLDGNTVTLRCGSAWTNALTIKANGNVLIGTTTNSGAKLYVNGYQYINFENSSNSISGSTGLHINRQGFDSNNAAGAAFAITTGSKGAVIYGGNLGFALNYYNGSSHTRLITGLPNGNVGVGTDNPAHKFDVNGTARISDAVTMSSTLSVTTSVTSTKFLTNGNYGIWRGSSYTTAMTANDIAFYADYFRFECGSKFVKTLEIDERLVTVTGNLVVSGDTATGSDIRFKDKLSDHRIALSDIADAPLFTFKWNDREDDSVHLGSSAQYWEKVTPWLVKGEDFKTLDYSTLGVAIGISLANKTINLEDRVKTLEKENEVLKAEIRRIQYGN